MRTVEHMVDSELDYVKVASLSVDDDCCKHRQRILDLTLRRPLRTRGCLDRDALKQECIDSMCVQAEDMLNADWAVPRLRHLCRMLPSGRRHCSCRADAVANVCHVVHDCTLADLGGCVPSMIKWWTFEPTQVA